ncbi:MAG: hypothetical protein IKN00_04320 [Bacteroidales bacterium]|nr:hypothetical protein [Bacteroidales bacterium]
MNKDLLRSVIVAHGDNMGKLAEAMGMQQSALSNRINGLVEFRQSEINFIRHRYNLTPEQMQDIFFCGSGVFIRHYRRQRRVLT